MKFQVFQVKIHLQNVKEDITDMLASLTHFTIPCPGHMTQFVLTPRFLEGIAANYDAVVTPGDNGVTPGDEPFLNVTVSAEYRDILTSLVAARIQVSLSMYTILYSLVSTLVPIL